MRRISLTVLLFWVTAVSASANAATLNVVGGQLVGASNVLVDGSLYDVEFVDGTCIALFDGCDSAADFAFTDATSAGIAAQALLDQVFLDGGAGQFDTMPDFTLGCSSGDSCEALTPYATDLTNVTSRTAHNGSNLLPFPPYVDLVAGSLLGTSSDTTAASSRVFARWSAVPEPTTAPLLGLGLTGLAAMRRRRETE